jgi:hypothetical protein
LITNRTIHPQNDGLNRERRDGSSSFKESSVSLFTKFYVFSILIEPLQYFVLVPQDMSFNINANPSRLLQLIVLLVLCCKFLFKGKSIVARPFSDLNKNFTYFFLFSVFFGILGYFMGSYSHLNLQVSLNFMDFVSSIYARPIIEFIILLYYFIYFVVLAQFFLATKKDIDYFFRSFKIVFFVLLFVGFTELLIKIGSEIFWGANFEGINIQFHKDVSPGKRFHSFIGEPRAAFMYLFLGLALFSIMDIWNNTKKLTFFLTLIILTAIFLTQAVSGVIGLICAYFLLLFYYFRRLSIKTVIFFSSFIISASLVILVILYPSTVYGLIDNFLTVRIRGYLESSFYLHRALSNGEFVVGQIAQVMNNVYPLWHLWIEMLEFNFFHIFFGNGVGSSSIINNYYAKEVGVLNPNSAFIKMLYENGIIGILLFISAFLSPIKKMSVDYEIFRKLTFWMIIMLGIYFGHKSSTLFIFAGVSFAILKYNFMEKNNDLIKSGI